MKLRKEPDPFLAARHEFMDINTARTTHNFTKVETIQPSHSPKANEVTVRAAKAPNLLCFIDQFPLAMAAIAECHDYGRGPLDKGDYRPSLLRHLFNIGEHPDHDAAVAWNAIAQLEVNLRMAQFDELMVKE